MSGIVFFGTSKLEAIRNFYIERTGCEIWLDQGSCVILSHGNMLLGFCRAEETEAAGIITFFYPDRDHVDRMHEALEAFAAGPPEYNEQFRIYQFFARDPEGRTLEFQTFEHELPPLDYHRD